MDLLIKNCLVEEKQADIRIKSGLIECIDAFIEAGDGEEILDAEGMTALPSLINTHTHAAMTLLRGYADDMQLMDWLKNRIWPAEAKISADDVYWGTKAACLEMLKSGATAFCDMYWHLEHTARAVNEMGLRCSIGGTFIGPDGKSDMREITESLELQYEWSKTAGEGIGFFLAPHAIYTVSRELLEWTADFARRHGIGIHTHLSETRQEYDDCLRLQGEKPVFYLNRLGLLGEKTLLAHCVWLDGDEIALLAETGANVSHNPVSNLKLAVGKIMPYGKMQKAGVNVSLGTDGCASNNSLNMLETMKFAALLQKHNSGDSRVLPAEEAFSMATEKGARALHLNSGILEPGKNADLMLVNRNQINMLPGYSIYSDMVYSSSPECIDTVLCAGKVLMRRRKVEGEEEIREKVREISRKFR